ncbi:hypothetical protein [Effusibacillus consociatus]|uniref:Uncharacterized protein n=1 Tax=Effusibacillus consociatus TaxID=1117041 RepID=A0ABV9Q4A8_9BACL
MSPETIALLFCSGVIAAGIVVLYRSLRTDAGDSIVPKRLSAEE